MMAKDYLKVLRQKGAERVRLTEQLQELCYDAAREIATAVVPGTEVVVDGIRYRAHEYYSNIGSFKTVVIVDPSSVEDYPIYRAIDTMPPGSEYYLHRDYGRIVHVATREEFLHFANHLPEIVAAFGAEQNKIIASLRSAFEKLRAMAE